ncbi:MAG: hypothetical protein OXC11_06670 [Rhodospirillales bacterium]|nr:hypothetical protein [Rhodospirillales bacterium]
MAKRPLMTDADVNTEDRRGNADPSTGAPPQGREGGPAGTEAKEQATGADTAGNSTEAGSAGEEAPALDEILRHVRYLTSQVEEASKREREPAKEESDVPAGAVEARESGMVKTPVPGALVGAASEIARALGIQRADFGEWVNMQRRGRRRWLGLAVAAGFPAMLLLGVLVQLQFEAIPPHDPSRGWSGWIWETHGRAIVGCAVEAIRTNAEVDCPLVVRRP